MNLEIIGLEQLTLDRKLQPRRQMDDALIDDYADAMRRGDVFPAIRVVANHQSKWLVDGWHRVAAAKKSGLHTLPAQLSDGSFEDAEDQSLTVNRDHGLRRTHSDVQEAIRRALLMPRWVERSDNWIAEHIGCRDVTVSAQREQMESTSQIEKFDELKGKDGKKRPRQRKAGNKIIIQDTYTITEWATLNPADQKRITKASSDLDGKGFNQQDTDNIEWARWSWNPVTGCKHNCPYCYARDIAERFAGTPAYPYGFEPVFHPKRLLSPNKVLIPQRANEDIGYKNVFVCSMADLFGRWVPESWIQSVLDAVTSMPQWNFLFLTKFPIRLSEFEFPDNAWIGTSVDCQARVKNAEFAMSRVKASVKWLSCEPLIEPLQFQDLSPFHWVVIGGASPSRETPEWKPPRAWVEHLSNQAWSAGCRIYEKDNLLRRWRQYPGHDDLPPASAPEAFHYLKRTTNRDEEVEVTM